MRKGQQFLHRGFVPLLRFHVAPHRRPPWDLDVSLSFLDWGTVEGRACCSLLLSSTSRDTQGRLRGETVDERYR